MAKLEQGILGPFRGTVGTVIGYRWRDRWCMRARPHSYHDRRSAAQLAQRSRFKAMIQFASPATPLLRLGLKAWAAEHGLTEGNAFLRLNHPHFPNNQNVLNNQNNQNIPNNLNNLNNLNNQNTPIAYSLLQFSHGSLPPVEGATAERVDALTVRVGWQRGLGRGADQVHLYAYCPAAATGLAVAAVERGRRQAQFILPQEFAGEEIHLWAFVVNAEGVASATRYVPLAGGLEKLENLENLERLENLEFLERLEFLENPETAGNKEPKASKQPRATAPQLQLALDFGAPPD